ncbi:MAG: hypothetical protein ACXWVD_17750 [Telluria sp.]
MTACRASQLATAALSAFILAACATMSEAPVKDATLKLQPQQTLAIGETISLRYDSVADSRCPAGARCIWAGKIVYHFTLLGRTGSEAFTLESGTPVFDSKVFQGVSVLLAPAEPPPVRAATEPPLQHPVTVTITQHPKPAV